MAEGKKQEMKEEVKEESVETPKSDAKNISKSEFDDIFVTESDTFDITIKYYKKDDILLVEDVDEAFDSKVPCKQFNLTFKYPDQGDSTKITAQAIKFGNSLEELDVREFLNLEFTRVLCLVRKWTLDQDLTNQNILKLHPKIVKAIISLVRDKIGTDGII